MTTRTRCQESLYSALLGLAVAWALGLLATTILIILNPSFLDSLWMTWAVFYVVPGALAAGAGLFLSLVPAWRRAASAAAAKRVLGFPLLQSAVIAIGLLSILPYLYSQARDMRVSHQGPKVVLIGLDGATWEIIDPLREKGLLPNISSLIEEGASGVLRSEEPSVSPALWTTIATGKSRGKHGVANFFSTQRSLRAKRVWEILEEREKSVGVMGWMVTWPPPARLNGFLVPSHLARGPETLPEGMTFLPQLIGKTRGEREVGLFQRARWGFQGIRQGLRLSTVVHALNEVLYEVSRKPSYLEKNHRQQRLALEIYRDLFLSLRHRYRPDFSAITFYGTDTLAHKYWRYFEPEHFPDTDPSDIAKYENVIPDYYVAADQAVGEIIRSTDEETTIIIVSDHGTKAMEAGAVVRMPRLIGEALADRMGVREQVDVTTVGNQVFMNLKNGSGKNGSLSLPTIAAWIEKVTLADTERSPFVVEFIDLEGEAGDYVGIEFNLEVASQDRLSPERSLRLPNGALIQLGEIISLEFPVSGTHHLNGVIILKGPQVDGASISGARIADVTPTVLYLMDVPVARDMDGKVLSEAIRRDHGRETPVALVDSYGEPSWTKTRLAERPLGKEVGDELRSLGYIN